MSGSYKAIDSTQAFANAIMNPRLSQKLRDSPTRVAQKLREAELEMLTFAFPCNLICACPKLLSAYSEGKDTPEIHCNDLIMTNCLVNDNQECR